MGVLFGNRSFLTLNTFPDFYKLLGHRNLLLNERRAPVFHRTGKMYKHTKGVFICQKCPKELFWNAAAHCSIMNGFNKYFPFIPVPCP